jgi:alkylhydroperoxidase/carboxymuconolactone decarboxylase family protein YurZ
MSEDDKAFRGDFRRALRIPDEIVEDVLGFIATGPTEVWSRAALTRRERSMVTIGILTALRANDELRGHMLIALENSGLTREELCEVVLHSAMYAGFPAALNAFGVASELFTKLDRPRKESTQDE